jgi:hypothetical protein
MACAKIRSSALWFAGSDHGGFTAIARSERLQTNDGVARKLADGHLKTETVINPINRCPTVIVTLDEVERFEREFVSLFALAKQQGRRRYPDAFSDRARDLGLLCRITDVIHFVPKSGWQPPGELRPFANQCRHVETDFP